MTRRAVRGFTFVELAVVVGIVAVFATLVIPSLAGASRPTGRPFQTLLESDLQRARTESVVRGEGIVVIADADGLGWRIARERDPGTPLDGVARRIGKTVLAPFKGCTLTVKGEESDGTIARYDALGTRDGAEPALLLRDPAGETIGSWTLPAGRTRLAPANARTTLSAVRTP